MAADVTRTIARRAVIAAGAAGTAALAAHAAVSVLGPSAVRAADGDPVTIGKDDAGTGSTWVTAAGASPALEGASTAGDGVMGSSSVVSESGVYGTGGHANGYGVFGRSIVSHAWGYLGGSAAGATGTSPDGGTRGPLGVGQVGAAGEHVASGNAGYLGTSEAGVTGNHRRAHTVGALGETSAGVVGVHLHEGAIGQLGTKTAGVIGTSEDEKSSGILGAKGTGVIGHNTTEDTRGALGAAEAGVCAINGGTKPALIVDGGVQLLRDGVAIVGKGKSSVRITKPKVALPEAAVAVLQADRPGVTVAATVVDQATGNVTIYLTMKVTADTRVAYSLFGTAGMVYLGGQVRAA